MGSQPACPEQHTAASNPLPFVWVDHSSVSPQSLASRGLVGSHGQQPVSGLSASQVSPLTRGGAEGRLILEITALCHLGVAGFIFTCLRVWGGKRK